VASFERNVLRNPIVLLRRSCLPSRLGCRSAHGVSGLQGPCSKGARKLSSLIRPVQGRVVGFLRAVLLAGFLWVALLSAKPAERPQAVRTDTYEVVHVFPHDPTAFTQGLVYTDGRLYESTGLNGRSSLRMVDLSTGKVLQRYNLPGEYFGEGLTDWGSHLVQLTWKNGIAFVYDRFSFAARATFHYKGEGWGLTHDASSLILSDGSPTLRFLNPETFREVKRISAHDDQGRLIQNLNELEYIHNEIYANVWQTDKIVRISPQTGRVLGWIDLAGLMDKDEVPDSDGVLNGIAYDAKAQRLFVTGKLWPRLFEIKIIQRP
jgi:glutaminyl-peptide cyclotransferase